MKPVLPAMTEDERPAPVAWLYFDGEAAIEFATPPTPAEPAPPAGSGEPLQALQDARRGFQLIYEALGKKLYDEATLHAGVYEARMERASTTAEGSQP